MNVIVFGNEKYASPLSRVVVLGLDRAILTDSDSNGKLEDYNIIDYWEE